MRRRHKHQLSSQRSRKVSVFKEVEETPQRFTGSLCPTNLKEQKEQFLSHGIVPKFKMKENCDTLETITNRKRGQIKFDYLQEAKVVLERVKNKYGDGTKYLEFAFGKRIDYLTASERLAHYLSENNAEGDITVYWTPDLTCSARMMWHGPNMRYNRPEARKYSLIIKNSTENGLLREKGILCLADHEIGTHFFRMVNDGFQPWFSDRKKFGLRSSRCRESVSAEEGFAALNTLLEANQKYLWGNALLYYTACMAEEMNFKELYQHLEGYVADPEQRWKHVMRCKRGLSDPNGLGGYGNDQCYFEGAVEILRELEKIDFMVLFAGKVCIDEVSRVRRLARMDCIRVPRFLRDIEKYKKTLRSIGYLNGIIVKVPRCSLGSSATSNKSQCSESQKGTRSSSRRRLSDLSTPNTPTPPPTKSVRPGAVMTMRMPVPPPPRSCPAVAVTAPVSATGSGLPSYRESPVEQIPGVTTSGHDFIYPSSPPPHLLLLADQLEAGGDEEEVEVKTDAGDESRLKFTAPLATASERLLNRPKADVNKIPSGTPASLPTRRVRRKTRSKSKKGRVEYFGLLERRIDD